MRMDEGWGRAGRAPALTGGGFERAAELRGDLTALDGFLADPATRIVPFWRGRVALMGEGAAPDPVLGAGLAAVAPGAMVLEYARSQPVFVGLVDGVAVFAADVSAWHSDAPDADPARQGAPGLPEGAGFEDMRSALSRFDPLSGEIAASARAILNWHGSHGFCSNCGHQTEVMLAGWQRHCRVCNADHFPRTDPVVIMCVTHGNKVLLGRSPGWREGLYSCLAGFMEPGESPEAAVRREVREETSVRVGEVRYIAAQPWPFPSSLMLGCRAEALSEEIEIDPKEIEDALWISRERLADVLAGTDPEIRAPLSGAIAGWLLKEWLADRI